MASDSFGQWTVPVGVMDRGVPATLLALHFYFAYPRTPEGTELVRASLSKLIDVLFEMPVGDQYLAIQKFVLFTATALTAVDKAAYNETGESSTAGTDGALSEKQVDRLRDFIVARGIQSGQDPINLGWLELFNDRPSDWLSLLSRLNPIRNFVKHFRNAPKSSLAWLGTSIPEKERVTAWRVLAHLSMQDFADTLASSAGTECADNVHTNSRFASFLRLASASKEKILAGQVDDDILRICSSRTNKGPVTDLFADSTNGDLLSKFMDCRGPQALHLAARCSEVLSKSEPISAHAFARIADRLSLMKSEAEVKG
ncbi:hypothetical protein ACFVTE_06950 [Arthrobacter sp. NPDC058097]|uniref:hypothetical protein n=1 Tax=Arthrobacter sp. NPDC058097 TaxID=3346340 RepID=UPI0036DF28FE